MIVAEWLEYERSDGRLFRFNGVQGRTLLGVDGFGMPPLDFVTQRGPYQHGETPLGFALKPRIVQLVVRHQFSGRDAFWAGRSSLLSELRPSLNLAAGILRYTLPDRTRRQLDVFVQEGPAFAKDYTQDGWDEWAYEETIRFIAHDPVMYDPDQKSRSFAAGGGISFPWTFPISWVGNTLSADVVYAGNWLEYPIVVVTGPITSFSLVNTTTNETLALSSVAAGETITLDLRYGWKTVTDGAGANQISRLTSTSDLATFHLAPDPEAPGGVNRLQVGGTGTSGATTVTLYWYDRYIGV